MMQMLGVMFSSMLAFLIYVYAEDLCDCQGSWSAVYSGFVNDGAGVRRLVELLGHLRDLEELSWVLWLLLYASSAKSVNMIETDKSELHKNTILW